MPDLVDEGVLGGVLVATVEPHRGARTRGRCRTRVRRTGSYREPEAVVAMAGGLGRYLSNRVRRILSGGAGREVSSCWHRWGGAVGILLSVLFLPSVPGPAALHTSVFVADENVIVRQIGSREAGPDFAGTRRIRMRLSGDAGAGELNPASNAVFIRRFGREVEPGADGG